MGCEQPLLTRTSAGGCGQVRWGQSGRTQNAGAPWRAVAVPWDQNSGLGSEMGRCCSPVRPPALQPLPLPRPRSLLCLFHKVAGLKSGGHCTLSGPPQPARRKAERWASYPTALAAPRSGRPGCPLQQPWEPTHIRVRGGPRDPPCGPRGPAPGTGGTCSFCMCFLNSFQAEARLTQNTQRGLLTTAVPVFEAPVGPLPSPLVSSEPSQPRAPLGFRGVRTSGSPRSPSLFRL